MAGKLKAANVPVVLDLYESPVCHMFIVSDPDKNSVMLHKRKVSAAPVSEAINKA